MNDVQATCDTCRLSRKCPAVGSSPLVLSGGKTEVRCRVIGGYAREPVPREKLSAESLALAEQNGFCVSLVEVPRIDRDSGHFHTETVKVFHLPVLHERETVSKTGQRMYPKTEPLPGAPAQVQNRRIPIHFPKVTR